jgi:MoaA/NifB/PqqE/SkfB family radical SAM enzyme
VSLFTTGTLLDVSGVEELAKLHLRGVELSLYSTDPAVHDQVTQRRGSHAKTMHTLESLLERGVPVSIKCPLMRSNFDSYPGLKALERLHISLKVDSTVTAMNDGDMKPASERLDMKQLTAFYTHEEFRAAGRVERRLPIANDTICAIGKRSCVIGPFGDVYTCLGYKPLARCRVARDRFRVSRL